MQYLFLTPYPGDFWHLPKLAPLSIRYTKKVTIDLGRAYRLGFAGLSIYVITLHCVEYNPRPMDLFSLQQFTVC